jgi:UrcA family protein
MRTLTLCVSATILSLAILQAAHASDASAKSRTVQFADLDLNKPEGAATLFHRIKGAALTVCGSHHSRATIRDKQRHADCIGFAMSNAVARVDEPLLTKYAADRAYPITLRSSSIAWPIRHPALFRPMTESDCFDPAGSCRPLAEAR